MITTHRLAGAASGAGGVKMPYRSPSGAGTMRHSSASARFRSAEVSRQGMQPGSSLGQQGRREPGQTRDLPSRFVADTGYVDFCAARLEARRERGVGGRECQPRLNLRELRRTAPMLEAPGQLDAAPAIVELVVEVRAVNLHPALPVNLVEEIVGGLVGLLAPRDRGKQDPAR